MKRKPIKIDWEELESAFDNPNRELVYYLDMVEGHVVLEGEGEEREGEGDDGDYDAAPAAAGSPGDDATRVYIGTLTNERKIEWVRRFVGETEDLDGGFADRLREALASDDPAPGIIQIMRETPEGKERWYLYRADRLHDLIAEWMEQNGIVATDDPPWV